MTLLQLVNSVLRRLREDEVTSVADTTYSKLITELVNQAKREVEDAWNWIHLRSTVQITTASGTFNYTLTGAGDRGRILTDSINRRPAVFNDTQDYQFQKAPSSGWMTRQLNTANSQTGDPIYFDINGQSSGDPNIDLWPIPSAIQTINFDMSIPQADFATDGTDDSTELTVPDWPVILGAYALAISERGEDGGVGYAEADDKYRMALSDAIAIDAANVEDELVWV